MFFTKVNYFLCFLSGILATFDNLSFLMELTMNLLIQKENFVELHFLGDARKCRTFKSFEKNKILSKIWTKILRKKNFLVKVLTKKKFFIENFDENKIFKWKFWRKNLFYRKFWRKIIFIEKFKNIVQISKFLSKTWISRIFLSTFNFYSKIRRFWKNSSLYKSNFWRVALSKYFLAVI